MEQKLKSKYISVTCPYCKKPTRGPGVKMKQAYGKSNAGMNPKQIANFLSVTARYVRELVADFPTSCEHCSKRLVPDERDWRILKFGWAGATQKQLASVFALSVYKIRQIQKRWRRHPCVAVEEFVFARRDCPAGWFSEVSSGNVGRARHPQAGYGWQR